jgi:hypothetical protein
MRLHCLLFLVMIFASHLEAQKPAQPVGTCEASDDYAIPAVNKALQLFKDERAVITTVEEAKYIRPLWALGDRASIALLKIYSADEILQTRNAQAYLTVVRNAFFSRSSVVSRLDTEPKVTLFVLGYLKEKETSNPSIEKRIEYLEGCVPEFTCSSQGEYNFLHGP